MLVRFYCRLLTIVMLGLIMVSPAAAQSLAEEFQNWRSGNPHNRVWAHAYIDDADHSGTHIRQAPGGRIVHTLYPQRDDHAYGVDLLEAWRGWFRIRPQIEEMSEGHPPLRLRSPQVWIHGSVLAVGTRNYGEREKLVLHSEPKRNSAAAYVLIGEAQVRPLDVQPGWLKIRYQAPNGRKHEGWVRVEDVCANPLSNCS